MVFLALTPCSFSSSMRQKSSGTRNPDRMVRRVGMLFCVLVGQLFLSSSLWAQCGDYLTSRFSHHDALDSGNTSTDGKHLPGKTPTKKCYSCRGATVPPTVPFTPSSLRVDIKALVHGDDENYSANYRIGFYDQSLEAIEGFYPSLLRPPIA